MIIKIKQYNGNAPEWHYWDNIDRVVQERILHLKDYNLDLAVGDIHILVPIERLNIKEGKSVLLGQLRCEQRYSEHSFRIHFNTEAYLCNDEGKTIEKIVIYSRAEIE